MPHHRAIDPHTFSHSPAAKHWERIGLKDHHGIIVPLFSIHSNKSCGIGEYTDLFPLIDWCQSIGFDVIQMLPLNDTGHGSSPYSAISAFALNPIFLGLSSLPYLDQFPELLEELSQQQVASDSVYLDYPSILAKKNSFLDLYVQKVKSMILPSLAYQQFCEKSAYWLKTFAVFKSLKTDYNWTSWENWPANLRETNPLLIDQLAEQYHDQVTLHSIVQFLCDQQLHAVKTHAEEHNVMIMGDLPILIDWDSADVWFHRDIFNLNFSAGAPPDYLNDEGQNWGFPIYNWDNLSKRDFDWWAHRLKTANNYYQLYRIDHIVGFFRIWAIPRHLSAKEGSFIPENQSEWIDHGRRILWMMQEQSDMLPIGEDLGVVPPEVRDCLSMLGICGTKVIRWERKWREDGSFIPISDYPLDSMTTVSTHDSEPLQVWWRNQPNEAGVYAREKNWQYEPIMTTTQIKQFLEDSHHSNSLFHINLLNEYFGPFEDLRRDKIDEDRINVPGTIAPTNWTCRFRPSVEQITSHADLANFMKDLH